MSTKNKDPELGSNKNDPWDEFYVIAEHWQSNLRFYQDHLRFLHHLIDTYDRWISKPENLDMVRKLRKDLFALNKRNEDLLEKTGKHLTQLGRMVEDQNKNDMEIIKREQEHLEAEITDLLRSFRQNRKEVFALIDSEELAGKLKPGKKNTMNDLRPLLKEITDLTTKIGTDYPEVYQFINEEPLTLPVVPHPEMGEKQLKDYLHSLQLVLKHHLETHKNKRL